MFCIIVEIDFVLHFIPFPIKLIYYEIIWNLNSMNKYKILMIKNKIQRKNIKIIRIMLIKIIFDNILSHISEPLKIFVFL